MKEKQISATEVAKLLLSFDPNREYFCDGKMSGKTEEENFESPTIGNFRLNKMLHICQMLHYAKDGKPLFFEDLRAYYRGAIVYPIYKDFFSFYRQSLKPEEIYINEKDKTLVSKIYHYFKNYSDDDLETFSHDDPAWRKTWYEKKADDDRMPNKELSSFYQKLLGHIVKEVELKKIQEVEKVNGKEKPQLFNQDKAIIELQEKMKQMEKKLTNK